jgi:valyl-tRNA synthetase
MLRLFAPFVPFATEEVWSWWQEGSIHRAAWPTADELLSQVADNSEPTRQSDERVFQWATEVLFEVRKQRSEAKQPLKVPITRAIVRAPQEQLSLMPIVDADLRSALRVQQFVVETSDVREVIVEGYDVEAKPTTTAAERP